MIATGKRGALEEFRRVLDQTAYILSEEPSAFFPQVYNRLDLSGSGISAIAETIDVARRGYGRPWLRRIGSSSSDSVLLRTMIGHTVAIRQFFVSLDSTRIVSWGYDPQTQGPRQEIKLWDATVGKEIADIRARVEGMPDACFFSQDGRHLVLGSKHGWIRIFLAETGEEMHACEWEPVVAERTLLPGEPDQAKWYPVHLPRISRNLHRAILPTKEGGIWIYDPLNGHLLERIRPGGAIRDFNISDDGKTAAYLDDSGEILFWSLEGPKAVEISRSRPEIFSRILISFDGRRAVICGAGSYIAFWRRESPAVLNAVRSKNGYRSCGFSPDGRRFLTAQTTTFDPQAPGSGYEDNPILWDAESGRPIAELGGHVYGVGLWTFSPDGRFLLTGGGDRRLRLWSAEDGGLIAVTPEHLGPISTCDFSPDCRWFVSACSDYYMESDDAIFLWSSDNGGLIGKIRGFSSKHRTACLPMPTGSRLVSAELDGTLRIWDADRAIRVFQPSFEDHDRAISDLRFSADGARLISASCGGRVIERDAGTGAILAPWEAYTREEIGLGIWTACVESPDSRWILTVAGWLLTDNCLIKIWDRRTRRQVGATFSVPGPAMGCFTPDSLSVRIAIFQSPGRAVDIAPPVDWPLRIEIRTFVSEWMSFQRISFSATGRRVMGIAYFQNESMECVVWDFQNGTHSAPISMERGDFSRAAFGRDEDVIGLVGWQGIALWDLSANTLIATMAAPTEARPSAADFAKDGRLMLTAGQNGTVAIRDSATLQTIVAIRGLCGGILAAAFDPGASRVAVGDHRGIVQIFSIENLL